MLHIIQDIYHTAYIADVISYVFKNIRCICIYRYIVAYIGFFRMLHNMSNIEFVLLPSCVAGVASRAAGVARRVAWSAGVAAVLSKWPAWLSGGQLCSQNARVAALASCAAVAERSGLPCCRSG